ncbi:hypothetical protein HanIR_Chr10g0486721 [Helianthus annuus]|nr:hypothetical protein HanIR_Chr10g0486721 [Helianthus annuus]
MPNPYSFYYIRHTQCTTSGSSLNNMANVFQRHLSNPYARTRIPNFVGWSDKFGRRVNMNVSFFRIRFVLRCHVFRSVQTFNFLLQKISNLFHHITIHHCTISQNLPLAFNLG